MKPPYVAFEGLIGVGKTSIARRLAELLDAELVLEEFEGNSFLPDYYRDNSRWALPMQLWFLVERFQAQRSLLDRPPAPLISDYCFLKEAAYARALLTSDREYELYARVSRNLGMHLVAPDLTVYLEADIDTILRRISTRGRPMEKKIDATYIRRLEDAYSEALEEWPYPLVRIDISRLNISNIAEVRALWKRIASALPASCEHPRFRDS